ncbi:MAG: glucokinase [Desulfobacteraceae bacterium]
MSAQNSDKMVLAGDIGGTKTHLAVFAPGSDVRNPFREKTYASGRYASLEALAREFLTAIDAQVERASFGVAGPVVAGRARITNLPWVMEEAQLAEALGLASVHLLNDLEAIAGAVPALRETDQVVLNRGQAASGGAVAVIAPGTGLGEAFLVRDGTRYRAQPSEGGHADFAPNSALQAELLNHLQQRFGHVSWERVCSGSGLPNIYDFLKASGHAPEPDWLAASLAAADDRTAVIVRAALDAGRPCRLCRTTLETFVAILGAEAGNLALKVMATGGVYLGGGMPPRILPALGDGIFMEAFADKGRMAPLLKQMPVHVITNPKAALWGAARRAMGSEA